MKITVWTLGVQNLSSRDPVVATAHASEAAAEAYLREAYDFEDDESLEDNAAAQGIDFNLDCSVVSLPLEMLVVRDPDADTEVDLWLNGEPVTVDRAVDVDPGRGYLREDWEESKQFFGQDPNLSEAFARAVVSAYETYADNQYIDDSGWGRGIEDVELPPMKEGSDA